MAAPREPRPRRRERAVAISERAYRSLLRAYPRALRGAYGDEMARCVRDLCREAPAGEGLGLAALWARTLPELVSTAVKERGTIVMTRNAYRAAAGVALAAALILLWGSLGLGVIGADGDAANAMYLGVLAVGIGGAVAARFQAEGMARALFAMAVAQALVAVVALTLGLGGEASPPAELLALNGFFVALFVGSALLFRQAARRAAPAGARPQG